MAQKVRKALILVRWPLPLPLHSASHSSVALYCSCGLSPTACQCVQEGVVMAHFNKRQTQGILFRFRISRIRSDLSCLSFISFSILWTLFCDGTTRSRARAFLTFSNQSDSAAHEAATLKNATLYTRSKTTVLSASLRTHDAVVNAPHRSRTITHVQGERRQAEPHTRHDERRQMLNSRAMRVDFRTMRLVAGFGAGLVTFLLLLFGSIMPQITAWDTETICVTCGSFVTTVIISHYVACYVLSTKDTREATFCVYWFLSSLFFDLVWEIPLWATSAISSIPHLEPRHLKWAIVWWSYSVSDTMYRDVTRLMVTFEVWYLLGNIPGFVGLYYYFQGRTNKALLLFIVCGTLQCYNATIYLAMSWYVHNFETVNPRGYFIFWGLNGCWACSSATAAWLSCLKLTRAMDERTKSE